MQFATRFTDCFQTRDEGSHARLVRMTAANSRLHAKVTVPIDTHIQYVGDLCSLAAYVDDNKSVQTHAELWFSYPKHGIRCNCIWNEVVMRACNLARRFIAETLYAKEFRTAQSSEDWRISAKRAVRCVGFLRFCEDVALSVWSDRPDAGEGYCLEDIRVLVLCLRAFAHLCASRCKIDNPFEEACFLFDIPSLLSECPHVIKLTPVDGLSPAREKLMEKEGQNSSADGLPDMTFVRAPYMDENKNIHRKMRDVLNRMPEYKDPDTSSWPLKRTVVESNWLWCGRCLFLDAIGRAFVAVGRDRCAVLAFNCSENHCVFVEGAQEHRNKSLIHTSNVTSDDDKHPRDRVDTRDLFRHDKFIEGTKVPCNENWHLV